MDKTNNVRLDRIEYYPITFSDSIGRNHLRVVADISKGWYHIEYQSPYYEKLAEFTTTNRKKLRRLLIETYKGFYRRFVRAANKHNKRTGFGQIAWDRITDKVIRQDIKEFMNMI